MPALSFDEFAPQNNAQNAGPLTFDEFTPKTVAEQGQQDAQNGKPFLQGVSDAMGIPALRAGITRLPFGIMQAESEGMGDVANAVGAPETAARFNNTADLMKREAASESANAEKNKQTEPVAGTIANIAPQIGQLAGFGTSLPGILAAGTTAGAAAPKLSPDDLQKAGYQPANTAFDQAMSALGYLPQQAVKAGADAIGVDPASRGAQAAQGALTAGEGYGVAKAVPAVANAAGDLIADESSGKTSQMPNVFDKDEFQKRADQVYKNATNSGQVFDNGVANNFANSVESAKVPALPNGKYSTGGQYLNNILDQYSGYENKPLSITDVDTIDKNLSGDISRAYKGGYNYEAGTLKDIQQGLRDSASASPAGADLANARNLWSAGIRAGKVQSLVDNAQLTDNPVTSLKSGARGLYKSLQKNSQGFSPEEIQSVKQLAQTGIVTNSLRLLGSRLAPMIAAGVGGAAAGPAGALFAGGAEHVISGAARGLANKIQMGKADSALQTITNRPSVQAALNAKLSPPPASETYGPVKPEIQGPSGLIGPRLPEKQGPVLPEVQGPPAPEQYGPPAPKLIIGKDTLAQTGTALSPTLNAMQQAQAKLQPQQVASSPTAQSNAQTKFSSFADLAKAPDVSSFVKPESGGNPNAKNPNSSASGLYQFTNKTFANMVQRYGQQTGITFADKNNPQAQATMARLYALDNIDALKPILGRMPTKGELYMAHILGAGGAAKLINAPADKEGIMIYPRQIFDANRSIFFNGKQPRTAGQIYKILNDKVA